MTDSLPSPLPSSSRRSDEGRGPDQPAGIVVTTADVVIEVEPGSSFTFGRRRPDPVPADSETHIGLSDDPRLHGLAGIVDVDAAGWVLTNTGRWLHLRVTEIGGPNRLELEPGRVLRIPYGRSRVEVATGTEVVSLEVDCPRLAGNVSAPPVVAGSTVGGLGLDRQAGYFRALVALCEPRLRDPQATEVATIHQIVRRLNRGGFEPEPVTAKAVERRLSHIRRKLALGGIDPEGVTASGLEARDASRQLADLALRTGTVSAADLSLIEADAAPERSPES